MYNAPTSFEHELEQCSCKSPNSTVSVQPFIGQFYVVCTACKIRTPLGIRDRTIAVSAWNAMQRAIAYPASNADISINVAGRTITLFGIRYSLELFEHIALGPLGSTTRIVGRDNGYITVQHLAPGTIVPEYCSEPEVPAGA